VALARGLVLSPTVLLLDEPFGAIDVQLRSQLQALLRELHRSEGLTIVMVTHDISEALALTEKLVVLDKGLIQQIGTADDILHRPQNGMVAKFIGHKNVFHGNVRAVLNGVVTVKTAVGDLKCGVASWIDTAPRIGDDIAYVVDASKINTGSSGENQLHGTIESRCIVGALTVVRGTVPHLGSIRCDVYGVDSLNQSSGDDKITFGWKTQDAFAIPLAPTDRTSLQEQASTLIKAGR